MEYERDGNGTGERGIGVVMTMKMKIRDVYLYLALMPNPIAAKLKLLRLLRNDNFVNDAALTAPETIFEISNWNVNMFLALNLINKCIQTELYCYINFILFLSAYVYDTPVKY